MFLQGLNVVLRSEIFTGNVSIGESGFTTTVNGALSVAGNVTLSAASTTLDFGSGSGFSVIEINTQSASAAEFRWNKGASSEANRRWVQVVGTGATPTLAWNRWSGGASIEGNTISVSHTTGNVTILNDLSLPGTGANGDGSITAAGDLTLTGAGASLGFFAVGPATRQTVTGSRGANAALASLLTALAAYGLVVDSTSA